MFQVLGKKKREDDIMGAGDVDRDERKRRRAKHKRIVSVFILLAFFMLLFKHFLSSIFVSLFKTIMFGMRTTFIFSAPIFMLSTNI